MRFERAVGAILAPGATDALTGCIRGVIGTHGAGSMLDVGCGADSPLRRAGLAPFGIDLRAAAAAAHRGAGAPAAAACATALPFGAGTFELVWSFGLLHHLHDAEARRAVVDMMRVTRPGGQTIVFDGVVPEPQWRRPLAALIRRCDRGRWMRTEAQLRALLPAAEGWTHRRMTYARTGLEGLWCVRENSRADGG